MTMTRVVMLVLAILASVFCICVAVTRMYLGEANFIDLLVFAFNGATLTRLGLR